MKEIWLNVNSFVDREKLCIALLNSGYKVRMVNEQKNLESTYWVIFEIIDLNIKEVGYVKK